MALAETGKLSVRVRCAGCVAQSDVSVCIVSRADMRDRGMGGTHMDVTYLDLKTLCKELQINYLEMLNTTTSGSSVTQNLSFLPLNDMNHRHRWMSWR